MSTHPTKTTPSAQDNQFRVRKRNRISISCGPCRQRKLKCDKALPCSNCLKRNEIDTCTYPYQNIHRPSPIGTISGHSNKIPTEVQARINRLEKLVLSLMPTNISPATVLTGGPQLPELIGSAGNDQGEEVELDRLTSSVGNIFLVDNQPIFVSATHWYTIVEEIKHVQNWLHDQDITIDGTEKQIKPEDDNHTHDIIPETKNEFPVEMLQELPQRYICDTLLRRFFDAGTLDPIFSCIIHRSTFQKQYDAHWRNPATTDLMWLGLLYAMMLIAVQSFKATRDEPLECRGQLDEMQQDFERLVELSITTMEKTKPNNNTVETLLMYIYYRLLQGEREAQLTTLYKLGTMAQIAMLFGYHYDPISCADFSPFASEMRRRIWCVVRQVDLLLSSRLGLQAIIRPESTNTDLPRNLFEDELHEEMVSLPPSRSVSEQTQISYVIYRSKLMFDFCRIWEGMQVKAIHSFEAVMKLDETLRQTQTNIPTFLKMRALEESLRDPPHIVVQRYALDITFRSILCILHRPYIGASKANPKNSYSQRTAFNAAMILLDHQATLHRECAPGGRLTNIKWIDNSLVAHDFMLATMIVSFELFAIAHAEHSGKEISEQTKADRLSMTEALEQARRIWISEREKSLDAVKAQRMLTAVLGVLRKNADAKGQQLDSRRPSTRHTQVQNTTTWPTPPGSTPESMHSRLPNPPAESNFTVPSNNTVDMFGMSAFGNFMDMSDVADIDWESWVTSTNDLATRCMEDM